jgi:hypothetical protein
MLVSHKKWQEDYTRGMERTEENSTDDGQSFKRTMRWGGRGRGFTSNKTTNSLGIKDTWLAGI